MHTIGMPERHVPDIVVARLPLYLRALSALQLEGHAFISSKALGERLGIGPAQIRKDLSLFGDFGRQGKGYEVSVLLARLREILNIAHEWLMVLVGAGHLGSAVANYSGFAQRGFRLVAVFDNDPQRIGARIGEHVVRPASEMEQFVRAHGIRLAMIAVPASAAQAVADVLVHAGVRGILNYAPVTLNVPPGVRVENIDPVLHLQHMTYYLGEDGDEAIVSS